MKTIAGAILMLAASAYAVANAIVIDHINAPIFGFIGVIHFLLGLYFLFFAKDKPNN